MRTIPSVLCVLFAAPLFAQTVTFTAAAVTPITARASDGTTLLVNTFAAGPLGASGGAQVSQPGVAASASSTFRLDLSPYSLGFGWSQATIVETSAPAAFAEASVADVLLTVQASSPITVRFDVYRDVVATAGAPTPIARVDVDADGTFEFVETNLMYQPGAPFVLGPQPRQVLVRTGALLSGPGSILSTGRLLLVPDNNVQIGHLLSGCGGDQLQLVTTFANDGIAMSPYLVEPTDLSVVVLGLGVQPLLVPSPFPACIFAPSPDLLVPLFSYQIFALPLPPAVRPVTVYAQAVVLRTVGLATTNAFTVIAN